MPTTQMCASCVPRRCDHTAVLFRRCPAPRPEFSEARVEAIGEYCKPAGWLQVFHALKTRGKEFVGGEVRPH